VTLTFWHTQPGAARLLLDALANDFHKAYPWITIRGEPKDSDGDLLRQGIAAMALNQPPDFILASPRTIAEFARRGALVALDPFLDDPSVGVYGEDRNDFFPGALETGRFPDLKNQLFAFPFDERAIALYYNADLLKAAKVETPPHTWDDFSTAARGTTKGNARGWAMSPDAAIFYAFLFSRGGGVLNETQTQAQFNDEPGIKSLQLIAALSKSGAAYLADSADGARSDFAQGKTALLFGTTNDLAAISDTINRANSNFQWGVANVPQSDPARPFTTLFGANVAIFKTSDDRARAAWLFARWLTAPAQAARWSRATLAIPVRASAIGLLASSGPSDLQLRLRDGFGTALPTGRALPSVKDAGGIDLAIVEMWISVANGADPAAAMNRAVTRVNRILGQIP
jgi:ABC-type glycerol-3-phosphate transport system substrate-binding protein